MYRESSVMFLNSMPKNSMKSFGMMFLVCKMCNKSTMLVCILYSNTGSTGYNHKIRKEEPRLPILPHIMVSSVLEQTLGVFGSLLNSTRKLTEQLLSTSWALMLHPTCAGWTYNAAHAWSTASKMGYLAKHEYPNFSSWLIKYGSKPGFSFSNFVGATCLLLTVWKTMQLIIYIVLYKDISKMLM